MGHPIRVWTNIHIWGRTVLLNVIQCGIKEGKPSTALAYFAHGTGLRMYMHELDDNLPNKFPLQFLN